MAGYINREAVVDSQTVRALKANVVVNVRQVGGKLVIDATEYSPVRVAPVSKTRMENIVREVSRPHIGKVGTPRRIAEASHVTNSNFLDDGGNKVTFAMRVRQQTFVVGK